MSSSLLVSWITPHSSCVSQLNRSNCRSEKHGTGPKYAKKNSNAIAASFHTMLFTIFMSLLLIPTLSITFPDLGVIRIVQRYWQCPTTCWLALWNTHHHVGTNQCAAICGTSGSSVTTVPTGTIQSAFGSEMLWHLFHANAFKMCRRVLFHTDFSWLRCILVLIKMCRF